MQERSPKGSDTETTRHIRFDDPIHHQSSLGICLSPIDQPQHVIGTCQTLPHRAEITINVGVDGCCLAKRFPLGDQTQIGQHPGTERSRGLMQPFAGERIWLLVHGLPTATNPIFLNGAAKKSFSIQTGEHFVIGDTVFTVTNDAANLSLEVPIPVTQQNFDRFLRSAKFQNAEQQIEALGRLPEIVAGAGQHQELFVRIVSVLLAGISHTTGVAILKIVADGNAENVEILHWDQPQSESQAFVPSERLIRDSIEKKESIVHTWQAENRESNYTQDDRADWAFCVPLRSRACRSWAIYVCGRASRRKHGSRFDSASLQDDLKFTEIVASTVGNVNRSSISPTSTNVAWAILFSCSHACRTVGERICAGTSHRRCLCLVLRSAWFLARVRKAFR